MFSPNQFALPPVVNVQSVLSSASARPVGGGTVAAVKFSALLALVKSREAGLNVYPVLLGVAR